MQGLVSLVDIKEEKEMEKNKSELNCIWDKSQDQIENWTIGAQLLFKELFRQKETLTGKEMSYFIVQKRSWHSIYQNQQ